MRLIDIINGPWAITPEMLCEIRSIYAKHLRGEKIDKAVAEQLAAMNNVRKASDPRYEIIDGTAIVPIDGIIAKKMNVFMAVSGGTSTQLTEQAIRQALEDGGVSQILLYVDSPGGTVDGTFELANFIFASRGKKPIITYSDGSMYSAAYAIGSAADRAYISSDAAGVGSIGVVAAHEDVSKFEEKIGVKTTEIYSGKYKRIASMYKPLSEEGRQMIQDEVDYLYSVFVNTVARNRGVSSDIVLDQMSTDVKSAFIGKQAIDAGLVDGFASIEEIIRGAGENVTVNLPGQIYRSGAGGTTKSDARHFGASILEAAGEPQLKQNAQAGEPEAEQEEVTMNVKELQEKYPDLYQSVIDEGRKSGIEEGKTQGRTEELARVKAVKAVSMPGHEALIESLMFDGATTGSDAAVKIVEAENAKRRTRADDIRKDGEDLAIPASNTDETDKPKSIKRKEFEALGTGARKEFLDAGGKVTD